jgi:hypothetical protein
MDTDFNDPAPLPEGPTTAPPGTEEKIRVLQARAGARVALFHPLDNLGRFAQLPNPLHRIEDAGAKEQGGEDQTRDLAGTAGATPPRAAAQQGAQQDGPTEDKAHDPRDQAPHREPPQ